MKNLSIVLTLVGLAAAAHAAGPGSKAGVPYNRTRLHVSDRSNLMGPDGPTPYSEGFEGYAAGSGLNGQGGWEIWYSGGGDATVEGPATTPAAASGANKLRLITGSDIVQRFQIEDGVWTFRIKTYVPSTVPPGIGGSVILLNQYFPNPDNWSVQLAMNENNFGGSQPVPYMIESQWDGGLLPLVLDQWIEIRSEIDLVADEVTHFYNNQQLGQPHLWTNNNFGSGPGITSIAALDLWSNGINPIYFDDISLVEVVACYPDCNNSGTLTIADFACFQNAFVAQQPYGDCNNSGTWTIADFACFQNAFVQGCP